MKSTDASGTKLYINAYTLIQKLANKELFVPKGRASEFLASLPMQFSRGTHSHIIIQYWPQTEGSLFLNLQCVLRFQYDTRAQQMAERQKQLLASSQPDMPHAHALINVQIVVDFGTGTFCTP